MNVNRNVGVPSNIDQFFIPLLTRNLQIMWSSEGSGILIFIFRLMKIPARVRKLLGFASSGKPWRVMVCELVVVLFECDDYRKLFRCDDSPESMEAAGCFLPAMRYFDLQYEVPKLQSKLAIHYRSVISNRRGISCCRLGLRS